MRKHGTMILLILIPVLILGLVSVMSNIVSNKNIKSVNNSASEIADNSMLSIEALGEIRQDTQSLHTQALSHIVATDLDSMLDIVEGLRDTQSGLAASLDEYEQFVSADDKDNFQALKDGIDQFNYHLADLLAFSGAGENEKAYALANGELSDSADNVEAVAAKLIASATAGADNARKRSEQCFAGFRAAHYGADSGERSGVYRSRDCRSSVRDTPVGGRQERDTRNYF